MRSFWRLLKALVPWLYREVKRILGTESKYEELCRTLGRFRLNEALRLIGMHSHALLHREDGPELMRKYRVHDGALAFIAMTLIQTAKDDNVPLMSEDDLFEAVDAWSNLGKVESEEDFKLWSIRLGPSQFLYQISPLHLLGRTLVMYRELWDKNDRAKTFDIFNAIHTELGLSIEEVLMFGFFYVDHSSHAIVNENVQVTSEDRDHYKAGVSVSNQSKFFKWLEATYEEIRQLISTRIPKHNEQYRINPLMQFPLIKPDRPIQGYPDNMLLVPIPRLIAFAVTRGLGRTLDQRFGGNSFTQAVGHIFEDYIHWLASRQFKGDVRRGWRYQKTPTKDTVDHVILDDTRAVLIEDKYTLVKQEILALGDMSAIRNAIVGTLVKAVVQLYRLRKDIESKEYERLSDFAAIEEFEHLIVTHDFGVQLNSILRDEAKAILAEDFPEVPADFHWHLATVDDIEYLMGSAPFDLFSFLKAKRESAEDTLDFDPYIVKTLGKGIKNSHLVEVGQSLFAEESARRKRHNKTRDGI